MARVTNAPESEFGPKFSVKTGHGERIYVNRNTNKTNLPAVAQDQITYHVRTSNGGSIGITKAEAIEFFQDMIECIEQAEKDWEKANG